MEWILPVIGLYVVVAVIGIAISYGIAEFGYDNGWGSVKYWDMYFPNDGVIYSFIWPVSVPYSLILGMGYLLSRIPVGVIWLWKRLDKAIVGWMAKRSARRSVPSWSGSSGGGPE